MSIVLFTLIKMYLLIKKKKPVSLNSTQVNSAPACIPKMKKPNLKNI